MSTHKETSPALNIFLRLSSRFQKLVATDPVSKRNSNENLIKQKRAAVRSCLICNSRGWSSEGLFRVRKTVEIKIHLNEATYEQWLILREIEECLNIDIICKSLSNETAWKEAIHHAIDSINANWFRDKVSENSREMIVANAVRIARKHGFRIPINGYGPKFVIAHGVGGRRVKRVRNCPG